MTPGNRMKGMVAGFVATVVLSALMAMKAMMGVMSELNPIKMITDMLGASPAAGWAGALQGARTRSADRVSWRT